MCLDLLTIAFSFGFFIISFIRVENVPPLPQKKNYLFVQYLFCTSFLNWIYFHPKLHAHVETNQILYLKKKLCRSSAGPFI